MSTTKSVAFALLAVLLMAGVTAPYLVTSTFADSSTALTVSSSAELIAALAPQSKARHIFLQPGEYALDRALLVPDGVTLEGAGVMRLENGLPLEFEPGTVTTIRASAGFEGDLLTLGDGVVLRGLRFQDIATGNDPSSPRSGNVIVVGSRAAGDKVSAQIADCEIVNPNPFGVSADGPTGHALVVLSRNPGQQENPAPHESSMISVSLERSIRRASHRGGALFVINFAASSTISLTLTGNRFLGTLIASAGASRPDLVHDASVSIASQSNLFTPNSGGYDEIGWRIFAGSSSHIPGLTAPGASSNLLRIQSVNDRIEGFKTGIRAAAARRWLSASGPISDNRLELEMNGIHIRSDGDGAADLELQGALSDSAPDSGPEFPPGDRNVLNVLIRAATGSNGLRANRYADVTGPALETNQGVGNRLEFTGSPEEFAHSNVNFRPAPSAQFFQEAK